MDVNFIHAELSNAETLLVLMREFYEYEELPFNESAARKALTQILTDESLGKVWLIQRDKEIAGYVVLTLGFSLEFQGRDAFIDEIYLRADFRGQGIGKYALQFLEDECRRLDVKALHLEVERKNEIAQAVYRKNGFADHDRYLMTKRINN